MERKLYVKWFKLYFNDVFVNESILYSYYHYGVPNEEPRAYETFEKFKDFYSKYGIMFDGYKNCVLRKMVKVGNTIIKKQDIKKITIMVYDKPYTKERQEQIIPQYSCNYWSKELNIEQFGNLCKDYCFNIRVE